MDFKFQYEHKHTDKYSIELFKKFESNIEEIMNNVCNNALEFNINPYNYQNFITSGSSNYIFKLNESYVLRFTHPLLAYQRDNSIFIQKNKELVDRELFGLNIQKKLSSFKNIANIYSYGIIKICKNNISTPIAYSIMDYLKGDCLHPEKKLYNPHDVKLILKILIKTLNFIHKEGYCHRDISYQNIIIKETDNLNILQLIDFGDLSSYPNEEMIIDDMWSLGILCCTLLLGKLFPGKSCSDIYNKTINLYPEFTDILNELLLKKYQIIDSEKKTNGIIGLKTKYEHLLTLPIFKNNDKT